MAVVKINAIDVPPGASEELERRFAARAGAVENSPAFSASSCSARSPGRAATSSTPAGGTEEAYQAWAAGPSRAAHAGEGGEQRRPVASGASLLEFEVVQQVPGKG